MATMFKDAIVIEVVVTEPRHQVHLDQVFGCHLNFRCSWHSTFEELIHIVFDPIIFGHAFLNAMLKTLLLFPKFAVLGAAECTPPILPTTDHSEPSCWLPLVGEVLLQHKVPGQACLPIHNLLRNLIYKIATAQQCYEGMHRWILTYDRN